jgi:hypothetical protein
MLWWQDEGFHLQQILHTRRKPYKVHVSTTKFWFYKNTTQLFLGLLSNHSVAQAEESDVPSI